MNMTTLPEMRDLAHGFLLMKPVRATPPSHGVRNLRVYEKLRQSLGAFAGVCRFSVARLSCSDAGQAGGPSLERGTGRGGWNLDRLSAIESQIDTEQGSGRRGRSHSHRSPTRTASYLPWRSFNVEPVRRCVARCSLDDRSSVEREKSVSTQDKVKINKLPTGVPGLDEIVGGGLPEFSFNIIAGAPGSGKTTLAHQFVFANATPERPALYFTVLGESAIKMLRYQQQYTILRSGQAARLDPLYQPEPGCLGEGPGCGLGGDYQGG